MDKIKGVLLFAGLLMLVGFAAVQIQKEKILPSPIDNLAQVPTTGLVLKYDFTGGLATDTSGNNLHGTVTNAGVTTGVVGDAINLSSSSVALGSPAQLDDLGPMTISFWVNPMADGYLISKRDSSCSGYWRIGYYNGYIQLLNLKGYSANTLVGVTPGSWSHVVYTWDGTKNSSGTKIYINGVDQTQLTMVGTASSDSSCNMYLGTRANSTEFFTGAMDELYIYNRILSQSEISSLYTASGVQPFEPAPTTTTTTTPTTTTTTTTSTFSTSGVAELPRITPAYTDPYPGRACTTTIPIGGNINTALSMARGGDVVCLTPGATYDQVYLPARALGDTGYIVLRTNTALPAEGTRVTPSSSANFATISTSNAEPALRTTTGTHSWYIAGVRFKTTAPLTYQILNLGASGTEQDTEAEIPQRLVLSRVLIDGGSAEVQRCITLNSGETAVVDSWLQNCHIKGFEGHGIGGWNSPGPHLIQNNYIEAAGINTIWGGATPSIPNLRASDITVRNNHFRKPPEWKGIWYPVKNLFEIKNATRVLVENNVMDGSWEEASHGGAAMWIKSINDSGDCTWCETSHVTVRLNDFRNLGMGLAINGSECYASTGCSIFPKAANHIHIHDNVFGIVNSGTYTGYGRVAYLAGGATDITLERNVATGNVSLMLLLVKDRPVDRVTFRDNVWGMGDQALHVDPGGGVLDEGAKNTVWDRMTLVGSITPSGLPPSTVVSSESQAVLASQIRSTVAAATVGVTSGTGSTISPLPVVTITATPASISAGSSSQLVWSATNAISCTATGGWAGAKPTSGSQSVTPSTTTSYTLACIGAGGSSSGSVTVTVESVPTEVNPTPTTSFSVTSPTATSITATGAMLGGNVVSAGSGATITNRGTCWDIKNDSIGNCMSDWVGAIGPFTQARTGMPSNTLIYYYAYAENSLGGWTNSPLGTFTTAAAAPTPTPTPEPEPTPPPTPPSTKFSAGARIQTTDVLNVRSSGSTNGTILGIQTNGALGTIISGGQYADGYYWWQVDYDNAPDGWSAENYLTNYIAPAPAPEPTPEPTPTPEPEPTPIVTFVIGDTVEVTADKLNIRSQPTTSGKPLGKQPRGARGQIIAGPVVAQGYTWWQVNFTTGVDGWAAGDYLKKVTN